MSRSTRQRKPVNYRKLLDESEDSDDDFASGPPPKKPRAGGGPGGDNSTGDVKSKDKDSLMKAAPVQEVPKKPARLSRDEKLFTRELEQALTVSKKELGNNTSVSSEPTDSSVETPLVDTSSVTCTAEGSKEDGEFIPDKSDSSESEEESFSMAEEDEDSDFTASPQPKKDKKKGAKENAKSAPKGKQQKAKKLTAKSVVNVDKLSTNSLPRNVTKQTAVKVTPAKTTRQKLTTNVVPKTTVSDGAKQVKSSVKSGGSPGVLGVNKRALNWTPPAKVGEGKTKTDSLVTKPTHVHSSSSGGGTPVIRIGLSRNARVKSLHTNIKT